MRQWYALEVDDKFTHVSLRAVERRLLFSVQY